MPVGNKNQAIAGLGCHHIAIQTHDWDASEQFYIEVMGMEKVVEFIGGGRRISLLDIGDGSHLELFEPTGEHADAPVNNTLVHFALATTDIGAALERVRAAGMDITREASTVNLGGMNVTIAFFTGPSGEVVEFFQVNESAWQ